MPHPLDPDSAISALARIRRTRLAVAPTPLLSAPRLAGLVHPEADIWVKADAWTGLGLGGNKVRKLEYELDPARLRAANHLVTAGGPHSNHCRVTAAAAARLGLGCTLVIDGEPEDERRGNAFLHRILGARIVTVASRDDRAAAMAEASRRIEAAGDSALVVPVGASTPRGALGYVRCLAELRAQLAWPGIPSPDSRGGPPWIFTASSSGGTLAGLIAGAAMLEWDVRLVGVSPDEDASTALAAAAEIAVGAVRLLDPRFEDAARRRADEVLFTDEFVGPGYGHPTDESLDAIATFGIGAGIILDPVYTAKAAAAMIAWIRAEKVPPGARAVFLHTGGHPALFR